MRRATRPPSPPRPLEDADGVPGDVGVDVGVLLARAEPAGALAPDLDDLVGEVAAAVLAAGLALPERDVGEESPVMWGTPPRCG